MEESKDEQLIENLTQHLQDQIESLDLSAYQPPFIASVFRKSRQSAFEKLLKEIKDKDFEQKQKLYQLFEQKVNVELLYEFKRKMKDPYYRLILHSNYGVPKGYNIPKTEQDYGLIKDIEKLSDIISDWCIQIEIAADMVDRAELLELFESEKSEREIYKDLLKNLQGEEQTSFFGKVYRFFKKQFIKLIQGLSGLVWSKGLALSNLSFGVLYILFYSMMGNAAFPIQYFLPRLNLQYFAGGMLGSLAISKMANQLEASQVAQQLQNLGNVFRSITTNLIEFNDQCHMKIKICVYSKTLEELEQNKKQLNEMFRTLLESSQDLKKLENPSKKLKTLKEGNCEDDWCELEEEDQENKNEIEMIEFASDEEEDQQQQQQQFQQQISVNNNQQSQYQDQNQ